MQLNRAGPDIVVNARNAAVPIVRPILPAYESELQRFIRNLSPASRYRRFMMSIRELPEEMLSSFANPEPGREAALVACSPSASIIGLAQYVADETGTGCEVAVVVDDAWQRQGLGYALFDRHLCIATHRGITHAFADVLADNHAMHRLASKFGCGIRTNRLAPLPGASDQNTGTRGMRAQIGFRALPWHAKSATHVACDAGRMTTKLTAWASLAVCGSLFTQS